MTTFAVTWDYRCPFARNAHEHVLTGLAAGAPWDVRFLAFSLNQVHVEDGAPDVWDEPRHAPSLLAMQIGIAVRDTLPAQFPAVHRALFAARHDQGHDIRDRDVLRRVLRESAVDADAVFAEVAGGRPLATFRAEHEGAVRDHRAFGVPTFIAGDDAAFVRLMDRPGDDASRARATVDRVVELLGGWVDLNELKRPTIPR